MKVSDGIRTHDRLDHNSGAGIAMYTTYIASRTQIYLHEHQERRLKERSRQLGRTKSALIREAIDAYLSPSCGEEEALMRLHAAVEEARGAAPDLPSGADYVEELRAAEAGRQRAHDRRG
jgi:predicted DNA-binding protein